MTANDLSLIESSLNLNLPANYKQAMLNYPYPEFPEARTFQLLDSSKEIIELNQFLRTDGFLGKPWKASYYCMGGDGSERCYYTDLELDASPVFESTEEVQHIVMSESFDDWIEALRGEMEWDKERHVELERIEKERKWWQFWR